MEERWDGGQLPVGKVVPATDADSALIVAEVVFSLEFLNFFILFFDFRRLRFRASFFF